MNRPSISMGRGRRRRCNSSASLLFGSRQWQEGKVRSRIPPNTPKRWALRYLGPSPILLLQSFLSHFLGWFSSVPTQTLITLPATPHIPVSFPMPGRVNILVLTACWRSPSCIAYRYISRIALLQICSHFFRYILVFLILFRALPLPFCSLSFTSRNSSRNVKPIHYKNPSDEPMYWTYWVRMECIRIFGEYRSSFSSTFGTFLATYYYR